MMTLEIQETPPTGAMRAAEDWYSHPAKLHVEGEEASEGLQPNRKVTALFEYRWFLARAPHPDGWEVAPESDALAMKPQTAEEIRNFSLMGRAEKKLYRRAI